MSVAQHERVVFRKGRGRKILACRKGIDTQKQNQASQEAPQQRRRRLHDATPGKKARTCRARDGQRQPAESSTPKLSRTAVGKAAPENTRSAPPGP